MGEKGNLQEHYEGEKEDFSLNNSKERCVQCMPSICVVCVCVCVCVCVYVHVSRTFVQKDPMIVLGRC